VSSTGSLHNCRKTTNGIRWHTFQGNFCPQKRITKHDWRGSRLSRHSNSGVIRKTFFLYNLQSVNQSTSNNSWRSPPNYRAPRLAILLFFPHMMGASSLSPGGGRRRQTRGRPGGLPSPSNGPRHLAHRLAHYFRYHWLLSSCQRRQIGNISRQR
jgi:hypothetical protein